MRTPIAPELPVGQDRSMSNNDEISGRILDGDKPVATVKHGEVFADATGEKVGFIRERFVCGLKGQRLFSLADLSSGQPLPEKIQKLLKL